MLTQKRILSRLAAENGPMCFGPDRRAYPRVAFDCPVHWRSDGEVRLSDRMGWACNASETGACFTLKSTQRPTVGDSGRLIFHVDNYYQWLLGQKSVVQWCQQLDEGLYQVGVRLCEFEDEAVVAAEND